MNKPNTALITQSEVEPVVEAFTARELAQEILRRFDQDIPNTIVAMLRIVLTHFIETGKYIDELGMLIGKQPVPPLGVQRWERYAKELQGKLDSIVPYATLATIRQKCNVDENGDPVGAQPELGWETGYAAGIRTVYRILRDVPSVTAMKNIESTTWPFP